MEKRILALGAAVGAGAAAFQTAAIVAADQYGMDGLIPVAIITGLVGTTVGAVLAAYRANS